MTKYSVTVPIDTDNLSSLEDGYLATLWAVAQANPVDGFKSSEPGQLVQALTFEILRRWLKNAPPQIYHHQPTHYQWHILAQNGKWEGEGEDRRWVYSPMDAPMAERAK